MDRSIEEVVVANSSHAMRPHHDRYLMCLELRQQVIVYNILTTLHEEPRQTHTSCGTCPECIVDLE
eukprot:1881227-Amphidinium_carterae.1